jgi:hypothetical protein
VDRITKHIGTLISVLTLFLAGGAFYVNAKADDKAEEKVAPVEKRVAELERQESAAKQTFDDIKATLSRIESEQQTTRSDIKEILRYQRSERR